MNFDIDEKRILASEEDYENQLLEWVKSEDIELNIKDIKNVLKDENVRRKMNEFNRNIKDYTGHDFTLQCQIIDYLVEYNYKKIHNISYWRAFSFLVAVILFVILSLVVI